MGQLTKTFTIRGKTLKEAWNDYLEEDVRENGEGHYNGTIRSVEYPKIVDKLPEDVNKYQSFAVCIKSPKINTNKIKSEVTNFPCKETRKWETYYYSKDKWTGNIICTDTSQTECIKKVRAHVEKHGGILEVHIGKRLVKLSTKVAEVSYKASSKEENGVWECIAGCPY